MLLAERRLAWMGKAYSEIRYGDGGRQELQ